MFARTGHSAESWCEIGKRRRCVVSSRGLRTGCRIGRSDGGSYPRGKHHCRSVSTTNSGAWHLVSMAGTGKRGTRALAKDSVWRSGDFRPTKCLRRNWLFPKRAIDGRLVADAAVAPTRESCVVGRAADCQPSPLAKTRGHPANTQELVAIDGPQVGRPPRPPCPAVSSALGTDPQTSMNGHSSLDDDSNARVENADCSRNLTRPNRDLCFDSGDSRAQARVDCSDRLKRRAAPIVRRSVQNNHGSRVRSTATG